MGQSFYDRAVLLSMTGQSCYGRAIARAVLL
jgi:hypothetical protein